MGDNNNLEEININNRKSPSSTGWIHSGKYKQKVKEYDQELNKITESIKSLQFDYNIHVNSIKEFKNNLLKY